MEVGHYLTVAWILGGIGLVSGFVRQWITWAEDNYLWSAERMRRRRARRSAGQQALVNLGIILFMVMVPTFPFVAELQSNTGRYRWDFSGNEIKFLMGLWWNCVFVIGWYGMVLVLVQFAIFWRYEHSHVWPDPEP
jgi:hypothetical protein